MVNIGRPASRLALEHPVFGLERVGQVASFYGNINQ